ncbi:hypothetical protein CROQUDRAFT_655430 [Cronartium quercuum f. sp. fusiforme G11]|uniref:RNA polymerase II subunit A C-terminal domain phosphatase n=1 Tax=Cronartium quercuum f. sp. fusiforme G11 TaxID=708437 RepID=A0A9P6NJ99_9BASI|nr:hypothetical protein CROQUDRAFT_655430 [Cronartium quercuum f. sp. fusiforme G11]
MTTDQQPPHSPGPKQVRRRKKLDPSDRPGSSGPTNNIARDNQPTPIILPPSISLPITIVKLFVPASAPDQAQGAFVHQTQPDAHVLKTTPLFSYLEGVVERETRPGSASKGKHRAQEDEEQLAQPTLATYESPVTGELVRWCVNEGMVLDQAAGWTTNPILFIMEPCTHSVQWHGQCAICGSDLTISDYTGISETSRASIPMSHGPSTLTVSISEARRLESETRRRLLGARKLSLIVDLDQTIVHATVDPTVGEWMTDPSNPNFAALQGVGKFQLQDGSGGGTEGCFYYLKMRPGLSQFLYALAEKYEMHVYTMGTRAYADAVCRLIDPTGELFGNRVLSRDESGSMTQKSLTRLFPVDTSMVVIIDDRGDVWEYSPNLVSVVPYNFFVGIGDINGAFLPPPSRPLPLDSVPPPPPLPPPTIVGPTASDESEPKKDEVVRTEAQSRVLADQLLSRPLKQKQIELEESEAHAQETSGRLSQSAVSESSRRSSRANTPQETDEVGLEKPQQAGSNGETQSDEVTTTKKESEDEAKPEPVVVGLPSGGGGRAVLVDHDQELARLGSILADIHTGFYSQDVIEQADVREVISALKHDVLQGVHLAFSSLWPMDVIPDQQDAWKLAEQFGAHCYPKLTPRITHLVAAKLGTSKVNTALRRPNLSVVSPKWLFDAVTLWTHPKEVDYLWHNPQRDRLGQPPEKAEVEDEEVEEEEDDEGWGAEMEGFDWKDAEEEVMAAMMEESSEEGEDGEGDGYEERGRRSREVSEGRSVKRPRTGRSRSRLREEVGEEETSQAKVELSEDEDEFLSRLAAEVEGEMS